MVSTEHPSGSQNAHGITESQAGLGQKDLKAHLIAAGAPPTIPGCIPGQEIGIVPAPLPDSFVLLVREGRRSSLRSLAVTFYDRFLKRFRMMEMESLQC